jgi:hypothetical protein
LSDSDRIQATHYHGAIIRPDASFQYDTPVYPNDSKWLVNTLAHE